MAKRGTKEWRDNISKGRRANPSPNARYWLGKKFSKKHLENLSKATAGKNNPRYGVRIDEGLKRKIGEAIHAHYQKYGTDKLKGKRPQTSKALMGHFVSEETKQKLREIGKLRTGDKGANWKGGKPRCVDCNKIIFYTSKRCSKCYKKINAKRLIKRNKSLSKEEKVKIAVMGRKALGEMKGPTSIEKKVYDELKSRGVLFESQKLINNKFVVDVYIPMLNLVIECDGEYWHLLPKIQDRDARKDKLLISLGYKVLRFSG